MRTWTIALAAVLSLALSPVADAKPGKGKGNHDDDSDSTNGAQQHPGGGGGGPTTTIRGAGQRLHFSFGGKLRLKAGKLKGNFVIVAHPLAPDSTRLTVSCRFFEFKNATLAGPRLEFDAKGHCAVLETDGDIQKIHVENHVVIVDNPAGTDQIDVEFIGQSGIMIPGGELSFGNFTLATS